MTLKYILKPLSCHSISYRAAFVLYGRTCYHVSRMKVGLLLMVRYHFFGKKIALIPPKHQFSVQSIILIDRPAKEAALTKWTTEGAYA